MDLHTEMAIESTKRHEAAGGVGSMTVGHVCLDAGTGVGSPRHLLQVTQRYFGSGIIEGIVDMGSGQSVLFGLLETILFTLLTTGKCAVCIASMFMFFLRYDASNVCGITHC